MVAKINVLAVGDHASGKFEMLKTFVNGTYPDQDQPKPPEFGHNTKEIMTHRGSPCTVVVHDCADMPSDKAAEPQIDEKIIIYCQTDIILFCISVVSPPPIDVLQEWIEEIRRLNGKRAPYLLVGTEIDRRQDVMTHTDVGATVKDTAKRVITPKKGRQLAKKCGATGYVECSARTQEGLQNVFEEAVNTAIEKLYPPRRTPARFWGILCAIV